jgi:formylglycine-generating enzyme required for sulfatase activity
VGSQAKNSFGAISGPPPPKAGNFAEDSFKRTFKESRFPAFKGYDDGFAYIAPVGSFAPNGYGLYDMIGNAAEWVQDYYRKDYYETSPGSNPRGPLSGDIASNSDQKGITRGGSWFYKWAYVLRIAKRESGPHGWRGFDVGFRCVMDGAPRAKPR